MKNYNENKVYKIFVFASVFVMFLLTIIFAGVAHFSASNKSVFKTNNLTQISEVANVNSNNLLNGNLNADASTTLSSTMNGSGTSASPYEVTNETQLRTMASNLSSYFKLMNDITLTSAWTPVGTSSSPFKGSLDGGNFTISNATINGSSYAGFFGYINGATIKNLKFVNLKVTGTTYVGGLIGYASKGTISNIDLDVDVTTTVASNLNCGVGGVVGCADESNAKFTSVVVRGEVRVKDNVIGQGNCIGGFSGNGGKWTDCTMYAHVTGGLMVGGFVGGYWKTTKSIFGISVPTYHGATFTNCYMAGTVSYKPGYTQNYSYFGMLNGYGAYTTFTMSNSGQRISVDYTSSIGVNAIHVFNASETASTGLSVTVPTTLTNGKYSFTADANITDTSAGMLGSTLSETEPNGITSNYGGLTVRFTMANGTYKYFSTMDKNTASFVSDFDLNLDEMTSYVDNFASMTVEDEGGTSTRTTSSSINIWGVVNVSNANDFEHLSWIVNGGIPTTIGGYYYNSRSVSTLSIKMTADIDLTEDRVATINGSDFYLNRVGGLSTGEKIYNFYGFGTTDMMPFRGSFNGDNHKITVNIITEKAYALGIICFASDQSNTITIKNLEAYGTIKGADRIGIVGAFDSYQRDSKIVFENVKNYINITGYKQVGGLLGYVQGNADTSVTYVTITNCENYGDITGTSYEGKASTQIGGFVGSVNNSSGLVSSCQFVGTNNNYGSVTGSSSTGYAVGNMSSVVTVAENSSYNLCYTVNVGTANTSVEINGTTYTSNENGDIVLSFSGINTEAQIPEIVITDPYTNVESTLNTSSSLQSTVKLVTSVELYEDNVYETISSSSNFVLKIKVSYNDGSFELYDLVTNLTSEQLAGNELVFANVSLTNADFNASYTMTLKRITALFENYVNAYKALNDKTSGTNTEFTSLGTTAYNLYSQINAELPNLNSYSQERANQYLTNSTIANVANIDAWTNANNWFSKIVKSLDRTNLNNITVDYGTTSIVKDVVITYLNNATQTFTLTYNIANPTTLTPTATTEGFTISTNDRVVYSFKEIITITLNKIDLTNIVISENNTFTFDGQEKNASVVSFDCLDGDDVTINLAYNGEINAKNVGNYDITVGSLSGADGIFYNIPTQVLGQLVINKLAVSFSVVNSTFEYNGSAQGLDYEVISSNDYQITASDFEINYVGDGYDSLLEPTNAGNYSMTLILSDNFKLDSNSKAVHTFTIGQKEITGFTLQSYTYKYNASKVVPTFVFDSESGVVSGDVVNINEYAIYNNNNATVDAISVGSYTVRVLSVDNANYKVTNNIINTITIDKAEVTIQIGSTSVTYGDVIDLSVITYDVISGQIYGEDDLKIEIVKEDGITVKDYELTLNYSNNNYNVTVQKGTYTISKKDISITFPSIDLTYNGNNQASNITTPIINDELSSDSNLFAFEIKQGDNVVEPINAGSYRISLIENDYINTNYNITSEKSKDFEIVKANLSITMQNVSSDFNEELSVSDLTYAYVGNYEDIGEIVEINPYILISEQPTTNLNDINAGSYVISASLNHLQKASNYDIKIINATLTIDKIKTKIKAENITTTYNGNVVDFVAEMFTDGDAKVDGASITYVITSNEQSVTEMVDAGSYVVAVTADAGNNYEIATATYTVKIEQNQVSVEFSELVKTYTSIALEPIINVTAEQGVAITGKYTVEILSNNESQESAINVGSYTFVVKLTDETNFKFATENSTTFTIEQKEITAFKLAQSTYTYNNSKVVPSIIIDSECGLMSTDAVNVNEYAIYNSASENVEAINYGDYSIKLISVDNANYKISTELSNNFTIEKEELTIKIGNGNSTYGDVIDLTTISYEVISGQIYGNDELNIEIIKEDGLTVKDYELDLTYSNDNYNVTVQKGTYTISKKDISITFAEIQLTYNGVNQANKITVPTVNNELSTDSNLFTFEIKQNGNVVEPINAGTYTISLVENAYITTNYNITSETSKSFVIEKAEMTITMQNVNANINQVLSVDDLTFITEGNFENVSKIVTISPYIVVEEQATTILEGLDVGAYVISASLTDLEKADNYSIEIVNATLTIKDKQTYIKANNITTTYNGDAVSFVAEMFTGGNEKIDNAQITYTVNNGEYEINGLVNAGTYTITITADAGEFYEVATGSYTVVIEQNEVSVEFANLTQTYSSQALEPTITVSAEQGVEMLGKYSVEIQSNGNVVDNAVNAGSYTYIVKLADETNFKFATENSATFTIEQKEITGFKLVQSTFTYNNSKVVPSIIIDAESGVVGTDSVNAIEYAIYNSVNENVEAINYGDYSIKLISVDNANYKISTELSNNFTIEKEELTIKIGNGNSTYGDVIDLTTISYEVISGQIYGNDELNIEIIKEDGLTVKDYELDLTYSNDNYNVTVQKGTYTISKKDISITFAEIQLTYNGVNQANKITVPTVNNELSTDSNLFTFEIKQNGNVVEPINAGTYTISLVENAYITTNYNITSETSKSFVIEKAEMTITMQNVNANINQVLSVDDLTFITEGNFENVSKIVTISPYIVVEEQATTILEGLDVGAYVISASLTDLEKADNYSIEIVNATLTIKDKQTYIKANNITTTYNGDAVSFVAEMFTGGNEKIDNAQITYTVNNGEYEINGLVNAGTYTITITADAGEFYEVATGSYTVVIEQNEVSVEFANLTQTYSSQALEPTITVSAEQGVEMLGKYSVEIQSNGNVVDNAVNAGSYTYIVKLADETNFKFATENSATFTIEQKEITGFKLVQSTFTYNNSKVVPSIIIDAESGVVGTDSVNAIEYAIYNSVNENVEAINYGDYSIKLISVDNANYKISTELSNNFTIEKEELTIKIGNGNSTYGDVIDLTTISYEVISGQIYGNDELNIEIIKEDGLTVKDYELDLTYSNDNYNVTVQKGTYTISKKDISITFAEIQLTYNGVNQANKITVPTVNNELSTDSNLFTFEIKQNGNVVEPINAGTYTISLVENAYITTNYNITSETSKSFVIEKAEMTITMQNVNANINQVLSVDDLTFITEGNFENVSKIVTISPYIVVEEQATTILEGLDVGAYVISASLTDLEKADNYSIEIVNATLTIKDKQTYIKANNITTTYNGDAVSFVAEMFTGGNEKIDNAQITYTVNNGEYEINGLVNAGTYTITITADAGEFYEVATGSYTVVIEQNEVSVEFANLTQTYSSQALEPTITVSAEQGVEMLGKYSVEIQSNGNVVDNAVNAGSYTYIVKLADETNFKFATENSATFTIEQKEITGFKLVQSTFTYNNSKVVPSIIIDAESGVVGTDSVNAIEYAIYNSVNENVEAINYGDYSIKLISVDNANYKISTELSNNFTIEKEELTIKIGNGNSTYGDVIDLTTISYEVISGQIYGNDELNIEIIKEDGLTVKDYELDLTYSNDNYNVTVQKGTYTISKRDVSIVFPNIDLTYNGTNQAGAITTPIVNNVVNNDNNLFVFAIFQNGNVVEPTNAGTYSISFVGNDYLTANYNITSETSKQFVIEKADMSITMQDITITFGDSLVVEDLIYLTSGNFDELSYIATISPYIVVNDNPTTELTNIDAGSYVISADLTYLEKANNYNIEVVNATIQVCKAQTYIKADNVMATYNGNKVDFVAELYTSEDEKVENVNFVLVFKKDNAVVSEIVNAGSYVIEVTADAGDNYEIANATYNANIEQNEVSVEFADIIKTYNKTALEPTINVTAECGVEMLGMYSVEILSNENVIDNAINAGKYTFVVKLLDEVNYKFATNNSEVFTIEQENLSITIGNKTSSFGEVVTVDDVTTTITSGTLYEGDNLNIVLSKEDGNIAGTYIISATFSNANYLVDFTNGIYTIERQVIDIEAKENNAYVNLVGNSEIVYNANYDYDLLRPSQNFDNILNYYYLDANRYQIQQIQNAGNYYLRINLVDADNYRFASTENDFVLIEINVDKLVLNLVLSMENKIYDGLQITAPNIKNDNTNLNSSLYEVVYLQNGESLISAPKNAGNYTVKVVETDSLNYTFNNNEEDFVIEQREVTASIESSEVFYNRQLQKPVIIMNNNIQGDDVAFVVDAQGGDYISANANYVVNITGVMGDDSANYKFTTTSFDYEIKAINAEVEVGNTTITYSGKQITKDDLNITFVSPNLDIIVNDYALSVLPTNAGEYVIDFNSQNENIVFDISTFNLIIENATINNITLASQKFTFDGTTKFINVNNSTLSDGTTANIVYINNGKVDAGTYEVTATISADNYNDLVLTADLIIDVYDYEVEYVGTSSYTYNKTIQGDSIVTHTNEAISSLVNIKYVGVGSVYESEVKPINAGSYKLVVSSNSDNVNIVNPEREFVIIQKVLNLVDLNTQTVTYNGTTQEYNFNVAGIIDNDDIQLKVLYNNEIELPINAGTYQVLVSEVLGNEGNNYKVLSSNSTTILVINPKVINVTANAVSKIYGENDKPLTFTSDALIGNDTFAGNLVRENGESQGVYAITIGTLTAGSNYEINYTGNEFVIEHRELIVDIVNSTFVYNGSPITPEIEVSNIVNNDANVYEIVYNGDRVNAGTFVVSLNLNNRSYALPSEFEGFTITVEKRDVSEAIIGLFETESDYNGVVVEPFVLIDEVDNVALDYTLLYKKNNIQVEEIRNAGTYEVIVNIDENNYKGTATFDYVVNKIERQKPIINYQVTSNSIIVEQIDNAIYAINNFAYQQSNVFIGLESDTVYQIKVKVNESENYFARESDFVSVKTTFSLATFNQMLNAFGEFSVTKIQGLKEIYASYNKLSEIDKSNINAVKYNEILTDYNEYLEVAEDEVSEAVSVSSLALGGLNFVKYLGAILAIISLFVVLRMRGN